MPRQFQRRRESAAAKHKSHSKGKPTGDTEPIWAKYKARQKAIGEERRAARARGGQPADASEAGQNATAPSSRKRNSNAPIGPGSQRDRATSNADKPLEDGELNPGDGSKDGDGADAYMQEASDMMTNVETGRGSRSQARKEVSRGKVMFTVPEAMAIYNRMEAARFPLPIPHRVRYEAPEVVGVVKKEEMEQTADMDTLRYSRVSFQSDAIIDAQRIGSHQAPSAARPEDSSIPERNPPATNHGLHEAARDYLWEWGMHKGKSFKETPDSYIRSIAGDPYLLDRYPAARDAFDYHRPGLRRIVPTAAQRAARQRAPPKHKANNKKRAHNKATAKKTVPKKKKGKPSVC